jgi:CBS domain-containing protein
MKVRDIMTSEPRTCSLDTNVAAAAQLMLDGDCGILPVLEQGRLVGVVTDRDLYIALATRDMRASQLSIGDVVQAPVHTCGPDDDIQAALGTMKQHRVRRLPVEGFGGTVLGIVSMNDILLGRPRSCRRSRRSALTIIRLRTSLRPDVLAPGDPEGEDSTWRVADATTESVTRPCGLPTRYSLSTGPLRCALVTGSIGQPGVSCPQSAHRR